MTAVCAQTRANYADSVLLVTDCRAGRTGGLQRPPRSFHSLCSPRWLLVTGRWSANFKSSSNGQSLTGVKSQGARTQTPSQTQSRSEQSELLHIQQSGKQKAR